MFRRYNIVELKSMSLVGIPCVLCGLPCFRCGYKLLKSLALFNQKEHKGNPQRTLRPLTK